MKREVGGTEKVVAALGRWAANDLAYIERLDLHASADCLTIVGLFLRRDDGPWPDLARVTHRVELRFQGVRGLRLRDFSSGLAPMMGFAIDESWARRLARCHRPSGRLSRARVDAAAETRALRPAHSTVLGHPGLWPAAKPRGARDRTSTRWSGYIESIWVGMTQRSPAYDSVMVLEVHVDRG